MPLEVKLTEKVSEGFWKAEGTFSALNTKKEQVKGDATILLKETPEGFILCLNSGLVITKLMGREVVMWENPKPIDVKAKKGASISIQKQYFQLKNSK
jgi:hypothetical protein